VCAAAAAAAGTAAALANSLRALGAVPDGLQRVTHSPGTAEGLNSVHGACAPDATGHAAAAAAAAIAKAADFTGASR
jgi:hypothetical protein